MKPIMATHAISVLDFQPVLSELSKTMSLMKDLSNAMQGSPRHAAFSDQEACDFREVFSEFTDIYDHLVSNLDRIKDC